MKMKVWEAIVLMVIACTTSLAGLLGTIYVVVKMLQWMGVL